MKRLLGFINGYRYFVTQDSESHTKEPYDRQMGQGGYIRGRLPESGVAVYRNGDGGYASLLSRQKDGLHGFLGTDWQLAAP
ncbi:MAG: hypothetical protein EXR44_00085 [Dehalococcoidia bacterium]|nr:hypothetical protein [Dehalococcoidia bacterium]